MVGCAAWQGIRVESGTWELTCCLRNSCGRGGSCVCVFGLERALIANLHVVLPVWLYRWNLLVFTVRGILEFPLCDARVWVNWLKSVALSQCRIGCRLGMFGIVSCEGLVICRHVLSVGRASKKFRLDGRCAHLDEAWVAAV